MDIKVNVAFNPLAATPSARAEVSTKYRRDLNFQFQQWGDECNPAGVSLFDYRRSRRRITNSPYKMTLQKKISRKHLLDRSCIVDNNTVFRLPTSPLGCLSSRPSIQVQTGGQLGTPL